MPILWGVGGGGDLSACFGDFGRILELPAGGDFKLWRWVGLRCGVEGGDCEGSHCQSPKEADETIMHGENPRLRGEF